MTDLRYPVGKFEYQGPLSEAQRSVLIQQIADTPAIFGPRQRHFPSRNWTLPIVLADGPSARLCTMFPDSHMNSYVRFKLALTEDEPTIKLMRKTAGRN